MDRMVPYGPRRFELEKAAKRKKVKDFATMTRAQLMKALKVKVKPEASEPG